MSSYAHTHINNTLHMHMNTHLHTHAHDVISGSIKAM